MTYDTDTTTVYEILESERSMEERETERERAQNCRVLKIVKQFSRPATFKSIKIDLFVMRGGPFGILQA